MGLHTNQVPIPIANRTSRALSLRRGNAEGLFFSDFSESDFENRFQKNGL
jgi:hypothetical protein